VNDERAADDGVRSVQLDDAVFDIEDRRLLGEINVAQVANVSKRVHRSSVLVVLGIEVATGRAAALAQVAERVYVEAVSSFDARQVAFDFDHVLILAQHDRARYGVLIVERTNGSLDMYVFRGRHCVAY